MSFTQPPEEAWKQFAKVLVNAKEPTILCHSSNRDYATKIVMRAAESGKKIALRIDDFMPAERITAMDYAHFRINLDMNPWYAEPEIFPSPRP